MNEEDTEELVRKVLAASGPRETLLLPSNASASDSRAAFRQLALHLHPDKCRSAKAEDAFKKARAALLQLQPYAEQTSRWQTPASTTPTTAYRWSPAESVPLRPKNTVAADVETAKAAWKQCKAPAKTLAKSKPSKPKPQCDQLHTTGTLGTAEQVDNPEMDWFYNLASRRRSAGIVSERQEDASKHQDCKEERCTQGEMPSQDGWQSQPNPSSQGRDDLGDARQRWQGGNSAAVRAKLQSAERGKPPDAVQDISSDEDEIPDPCSSDISEKSDDDMASSEDAGSAALLWQALHDEQESSQRQKRAKALAALKRAQTRVRKLSGRRRLCKRR